MTKLKVGNGAGFVKLYRALLEKGWLKDPKLFTFLCYCLLKATHKIIKILVNRQEVTLFPGQFIFGRNAAADDLNISPSSAYRQLKCLENLEFLNSTANNKFSIVTIINWHLYQDKPEESEQQGEPQGEQQADSNRTASGHKQEVKNVRTEEKKENSASDNAVPVYVSKKKRRLSGESLEWFEDFWRAFNYKKGKADAVDAWLDLKPSKELAAEIIRGAAREAAARVALIKEGRTPKMAQGWLSGRRWEDEVEVPRKW